MKPLQPGECLHRVAFDEPVTAQDDTGEEIVTWTPAFTLWASVEPLKGRERLLSSGILAEQDTRIRLNWSTNAARITAKWRARHRDVIYNISGPPAEIGMGRREFEIICTSGVNNG